MKLHIILAAMAAAVSMIASAQGHRGQAEPPLDPSQMELPAIRTEDVVLVYSGFVVNYNTRWLIPNWVAYELTAEEVNGEIPRANGFGMDPEYRGRQAMREDYSYSGWDKGHMAPSADMKWSQKAMYECFYLTNICPQNHELNGRDWQNLEKSVREWALRYGKVWVVCGPYMKDGSYGVIGGDQSVQVPDGFFKAILRRDDDSFRSIAFVFRNSSERQPVKDAVVSVNEVEALVGFDLFTNLDDSIEESVEAGVEWNEWIF